MADDAKAAEGAPATATVEVGGAIVEYNPSALGSMSLVLALGDLADESLPDNERLVVNARVMRLLFGENRYEVAKLVDESGETFALWMAQFLKEARAKN